jgi:hypothetical protein
VARQLAEWGDAPAPSQQAPPREVRPLQRDLAHLLEDLAEDFPLLASLVERRAGGQKRLPLGGRGTGNNGRSFIAASVAAVAEHAEESAGETGSEDNDQPEESVSADESAERARSEGGELKLPARTGTRLPAHYGLDIQFDDRPEDAGLGRLVESTVWVNRSHPAFRRALASHSIGYHIALTVAMSLAPLAVEQARQNDFLLTFLARWGAAIDKSPARRARHSRA